MRSFQKRKSLTGFTLTPIHRCDPQGGGFTLIETIVAIGMMTTGILGGLALAVYALGASDTALKQIMATNLAREGIEAVRFRRDYNWMNNNIDSNCDDIGPDQACYTSWDSQIKGTVAGNNYAIVFDQSNKRWNYNANNQWNAYRLFLDPSTGLYQNSGTDLRFYRRITIYRQEGAPFTPNNPRLRVVSSVWWVGKGCPAPPNPALSKCKVTLEDYLTNWKNY